MLHYKLTVVMQELQFENLQRAMVKTVSIDKNEQMISRVSFHYLHMACWMKFFIRKNTRSRFDHLCECMVTAFAKKWHPKSKRLEYIETYSISKWNDLPNTSQEQHSLANCTACYSLHLSLQQQISQYMSPTYQ